MVDSQREIPRGVLAQNQCDAACNAAPHRLVAGAGHRLERHHRSTGNPTDSPYLGRLFKGVTQGRNMQVSGLAPIKGRVHGYGISRGCVPLVF